MKKNKGFTLTEILIAISIFIIILVVVVVNFRSSNRLSELKFATDNLAGNLSYLQTLALSNVKINDYSGVERGYNYVFTESQPTFTWQEITSPAADSPLASFTYNYLETKDFSYPEVSLMKIEYSTSMGMKNETNFSLFPGAEAVAPYSPVIIQPNFLFPDASSQIILSGATQDNSCNGQPCNTLTLYLKHNKVNNKQGKVIFNKLSGLISSEIVSYP